MEEKNWKKENNPSLLVPMLHEKVCIFTLMKNIREKFWVKGIPIRYITWRNESFTRSKKSLNKWDPCRRDLTRER